MKTMERDSKGRFSGTYDPEIEALVKAENEQAQKLIKVCDMIAFEPEAFGIKKFEETGNFHIDYRARSRFHGITLGLALVLDKPREKTLDILRALCDALGIIDKQNQHPV